MQWCLYIYIRTGRLVDLDVQMLTMQFAVISCDCELIKQVPTVHNTVLGCWPVASVRSLSLEELSFVLLVMHVVN